MIGRQAFEAAFPRARDCPLLPHLDLWQRLYGLVLVRFVVAGAIVVGALFARHVMGITGLNTSALCILAGALFLCNVVTYGLLRPYRRKRHTTDSAHHFLEGVLHFTVASDFVLLAVALWLVGGAFSPFKAFFIFNVIIASVLLSPRAALVHALVAYLLLSGLVIGSWQGWIPAQTPHGAIAEGTELNGQFVVTVLVVEGMLILLTALLTIHLMHVLRDSTRQLVETNRELEHVSQLRRDFLHIALHNLRAPVGAVSMHISNLAHGYGGSLTDEQQAWIGRSQCRLEDVTRFLHDLECLAALEVGTLEGHGERIDISVVVAELVRENEDLAARSNHTLVVEAPIGDAFVKGVPRLIHEAIANYLTNAIKYTPRGGRITVRAFGREDRVVVEVEDNGIGIAAVDQTRLFRELVRIPVEGGSLGTVPGSGLGLYIVRRIAEMHGAAVSVKSEAGCGSTFAISFPKASSAEVGLDESCVKMDGGKGGHA